MEDSQANTQETSMQPIENIVQIDEGKMFTTSLIVAEAFEKNHYDVLKAISNLECSPEFNERNFAAVEYKDAKGEMRPAYRLTRPPRKRKGRCKSALSNFCAGSPRIGLSWKRFPWP